MSFNKVFWYSYFFIFTLAFLSPINAQDATDTVQQKQSIKIINADVLSQEMGICLIGNVSQPCEFQVLKGNVALNIDQTYIYADSIRVNKLEKKFEAFNRVHIIDNQNTNLYGKRLLYISKEKKMWLYEKVKAITKKDTLFTDELLYDRQNGIAQYFKNGEIHSSNSIIKSKEATYFTKAKKSILKNNVEIQDTAFTIFADSIEYVNDETKAKIITFISLTKILFKKGQKVFTRSGFYNVLNNEIVLKDYSKIIDQGSIYTAAIIFYNTNTKKGSAFKNFMLLDSANDFTLKADTVYFNNTTGYVHASNNCVGRTIKDKKDTLYFKADTLITESLSFAALDSLKKFQPQLFVKKSLTDLFQDSSKKPKKIIVKNDIDSLKQKKIKAEKKINIKKDSVEKITDTTLIPNKKTDTSIEKNLQNKDSITLAKEAIKEKKTDSTLKYRYIQAYRKVSFFKDSAQAICDSFWYDDVDSVFKFMVKPIFWFNNNLQLTANTINAYIVKQKIDSIVASTKALSIEHIKNDFYNQTQANDLIFKMDSNQLRKIVGNGNVITHYYLDNKEKKIVGMNKMSAEKMSVVFQNQKATHIRYFNDIKGKTLPIKKLLRKEAYLEGFAWKDSLRPKSKQEYINFKDNIRLPIRADFDTSLPYNFK